MQAKVRIYPVFSRLLGRCIARSFSLVARFIGSQHSVFKAFGPLYCAQFFSSCTLYWKSTRYLERDDLLAALSGIHALRHHRIIPVLEAEEQERIKSVTDDDATPLRDSAMILLGLSTGIRACDIIKLRLTDIDWRNDTISWRQSKTGNLVCVPLTPAVGNAIARYLTTQRPKAPNDYLFVRLIAPFDPLSCHSSCYMMVKRILEKASVSTDDRILGMHMLRHNAASTMVRNEVPIETIAAILGHSDPDTTGIYITTDENRLKECVLPFDGISREVHT